MKDRTDPNQLLLFPITALGLAAQRVVEGLVNVQTVEDRKQQKRGDDEGNGYREVHQQPPATRWDFGHGFGRPRMTAPAKSRRKE